MENKQSPIYWTIIKRVKDELEISINEYLLMESIYMLSFNEFNYCYASKETLARNLDLTKQTVLRLIEKLIEKGLLEKNINDSSKLRPTKRYNEIAHITNNNEMLPTVTKNYQDGNKMLPNDGNKMLPYNKISYNKKNNDNTPPSKFNNFVSYAKYLESIENKDSNEYKLLIFIKENLPKVSKMKTQMTIENVNFLFEKYKGAEGKLKIKHTLEQMENWKPLLNKNESVFLTLKNWLNK